jgi:hypothetical protein
MPRLKPHGDDRNITCREIVAVAEVNKIAPGQAMGNIQAKRLVPPLGQLTILGVALCGR